MTARADGPPHARGAAALDALLGRLPRVAFVCGKGGVGKTTCAAALAIRAAAAGERTLLLSTDPARTLGDALGTPLGSAPRAVPGRDELSAMQLDAASARDAFLARWRETLVTIVDRGTYLDRGDIEGLIDAALPGADEAMALLVLADLVGDAAWTRVVVDTAPTGHTLRLLSLPTTFAALVSLLDAMQEKHRFMVAALTRRYRTDAADAFIADLHARVEALGAALRDPRRAAAVVVARLEPVVAAETARLVASLGDLGIAVGALVVNASPAGAPADGEAHEAREARQALAGLAPGALRLTVPRLDAPPIGPEGAAAWTAAVRVEGTSGGAGVVKDAPAGIIPQPGEPGGGETTPSAAGGWRTGESAAVSSQWGGTPGGVVPSAALAGAPDPHAAPGSPAPGPTSPPESTSARAPADRSPAGILLRRLTIVGGKGGVGKTTAACALALAAPGDQRVLLVSTDPAPSVADALGQAVPDAETPVVGAPNVAARQMDAARAFARLRDEYQAHVDALFDGLMGGTLDAAQDRRVMRDLLALAPPGIDELYALATLGETLEEGRFDIMIVDPAPTGHLLRLLEMPALALDWSHRLLRLMLKYKEITGLGDAAAEVLAFAKRTRAVGELLRDPTRAALVCVALDEPLVRRETERLVPLVRARGVAVSGLLWNRAAASPMPLSAEPPVAQFVADAATPAPTGVDALRRWYAGWRPLERTPERSPDRSPDLPRDG